MPSNKFTPTKKDNGTYASSFLSEKRFNQLFKKIEKAQANNRRNAKRTLRPETMTKPTNAKIKALGEKVKGIGFTKEDLQTFDKNRKYHQEKYDPTKAGITYGEIVANSRQSDIKRANNQVDDNTGITRAALAGIKANTAIVRVKASAGSKHEEHKVDVRFESWDMFLMSPPDGDYIKATKQACAGRISFNCSCGRHQYWYRYLATMGNYAIAPPKEFSFPKIRNPELSGVACKHVLKAVTMLQSAAWHRVLGKQMEMQAKRIGYGDDRKTMHFLTDDEKKQASRNRSTKVDQEKARKAHKRYERSEKAIAKAIKEQTRQELKIKRQAKKIRKQSDQLGRLNQMIKSGFSLFSDTYKVAGKNKEQAYADYAKQMGVSVSALRKIVK